MPNKENQIIPGQGAGSAPELPHEVAKQYGLHHEHTAQAATASQKDAESASAADEQQKLTETESVLELAEAPAAKDDAKTVIEDSKTDAAVDDILAKESDQLLDMQGGAVPPAPIAKKQRGFWGSIGHFFARWWHNKWARWITIVVLLGALTAAAVIPKSRYAVLNTLGVRSSASVVVLDNTTQLPLKNVTVTIGNQTQLTNSDGVARFNDLELGKYLLTIKRIAFASQERQVTVGWGSNPLGSYKIKATGTQYAILVSDYVSGESIEGAEANSDEATAQSDKNGRVILTVEDTDITRLSVTVSASSYRSETVELDAASATAANVVLVPSQKDVFVSKQSGKYDVYTADLDGHNRKLLLAGTGNESSAISLVVSPDGKRAALVSTRDNIRDGDGFLLQALTIIDIEEGTSVTVDHAEQVQLVDWLGNRLIYRSTLAGASAADPQRNRLISYNYDSNARLQLATANQFNAIVSIAGYVYYTVSGTDPHASLGLFKIKTDGSDRKRLSEDEIWTALRTSYDTLSLQTPDGWSVYNLKNGQFSKTAVPASIATYSFADSPKGIYSIWADQRDGSSVLLLHDITKNTDKIITAQNGLTYPFRWINDKAIIYRVANNNEIADYVVSIHGKPAHKVTDASPAYGYAQIY